MALLTQLSRFGTRTRGERLFVSRDVGIRVTRLLCILRFDSHLNIKAIRILL